MDFTFFAENPESRFLTKIAKMGGLSENRPKPVLCQKTEISLFDENLRISRPEQKERLEDKKVRWSTLAELRWSTLAELRRPARPYI